MNLLEAALAYAGIGWYVLPVSPASKLPLTQHGHRDASTSPSVIRAWWSNWPDARIGVWLRRSGLMAVDVDVADGKDGAAQLAALETELGPLPRTNVQRSGRGGTHIVLKDPSGNPEGLDGYLKGRAADAVDVKHNGFVVLEPSGTYVWEAFAPHDVAALPDAWLARLKKPVADKVAGAGVEAWATTVGGDLDDKDLEDLAKYLGALKRGQGKGTTYAAVVRIFHDLGRSVDDGAEYLLAWNAHSGKPYPEGELARQVARIAAHDFPTPRGWLCGASSIRDALVAAAPPSSLTHEDVRAHLKADKAKLSSARTNPDAQREAGYLGKMLGGKDIAADGEDPEDALAAAAVVLVRHAPPEASVEALAGVLARSAAGHGLTVAQALDALGAARQLVEPVDALAKRTRALPTPVEDAPETDEELRATLITGQEGPMACGTNLERILRYSSATRGHLRYNLVTNNVEVTGGTFADVTTNGLDVAIKNWLEVAWGLFARVSEVGAQLLYVARRFYAYDPVAEYLDALAWDGASRVDAWLSTYAHVKGTDYTRKAGARWLISAVARALEPGCKVDTVLVLEGKQGARKSTVFDALGAPWFTDSPVDVGSKDGRQMVSQAWIVELAELASIKGREAEAIKAFLSARQDRFRPPYGRVTEIFDRRCVFAGTTNAEEYLHDATGNRRWWCARIPDEAEIDVAALRRDRDQIWAEAVVRYRAGERWWFERDEQLEADQVTEARRSENVWASLLLGWLTTQSPEARAKGYTLADIAGTALQIARADLKRHDRELGQALREAGFESRQVWCPVRRQRSRLWFAPE